MQFKKYPKVHRLGKEETDGILAGVCHVEEKIDGANTSIWMEDGKIACGSRNNVLTKDVDSHEEVGTFNGFLDHVREHEGIRKFLTAHPDRKLYGEWLVRHTIQYNEKSYRQFYLFDVAYNEGEDELFLDKEAVIMIGEDYGILTPMHMGTFRDPNVEDLQKLVGQSELGERGEGIVIKNHDFINGFGDPCYAKLVCPDFTENNAVTFGGNNKHSETYWEVWVVNKYMTLERVRKVMSKIQPEEEKRLHLEHIPRVSNTAYHDMLTEEIWEISKKAHKVDFRFLKRVALKKAIQIYKDILNDDISVADKN